MGRERMVEKGGRERMHWERMGELVVRILQFY